MAYAANMKKINSFNQGHLSVDQFWIQLDIMWVGVNALKPNSSDDSFNDKLKSLSFLKGLNNSFAEFHDNMLLRFPLPSFIDLRLLALFDL